MLFQKGRETRGSRHGDLWWFFSGAKIMGGQWRDNNLFLCLLIAVKCGVAAAYNYVHGIILLCLSPRAI